VGSAALFVALSMLERCSFVRQFFRWFMRQNTQYVATN